MNEPNLPNNNDTPGTNRTSANLVGWERGALEKLLHSTLKEQRAKRRWGIFFKLCSLALAAVAVAALGSLAGWFDGSSTAAATRHTALVELSGEINIEGDASADSINAALRAAFKDENTAGVVLRINSPGGSPVQSGLIYNEIRRLRAAHPKIPLYAVVEEVCASGGYYIASAADKIYVDPASLVGSIGVLMDSFGFTGLMDKAGVERRLLTAGANKGLLDPFSPVTDDQRKFVQQMLGDLHKQFIDAVKAGRGDRLKNDPDLFSGLIWTGARSVTLGLVDETGSLDSVARDVIKAEEIVDFTTHENFAEKLAKRVGVEFGKTVAAAIEGSLGGSLNSSGVRIR